MLNRIKEFADSRGLTAYALWKATTLSEPTVYRLYNDPTLIPSGKVLEGFAVAFPDSSPNDWLKFDSGDRTIAPTPDPTPLKTPKTRRRASTSCSSEPQLFSVGDCVRLPSGDRAFVDAVKDGRVFVTWESNGLKDDFPPHLLTFVCKAA